MPFRIASYVSKFMIKALKKRAVAKPGSEVLHETAQNKRYLIARKGVIESYGR